MAKRGRKGKRKGRRSKRSRKVGRRLRGHKFGIAESLGGAKMALDLAGSQTGTNVWSTIKNPSRAAAKITVDQAWPDIKANASPFLVGVIISNANKLPFVGKMLSGPKRKIDAVTKKWLGMRL